jgi:hypothetical protein
VCQELLGLCALLPITAQNYNKDHVATIFVAVRVDMAQGLSHLRAPDQLTCMGWCWQLFLGPHNVI